MLIMLIIVVILVIAGYKYFGYLDFTLISMSVFIAIIPAFLLGVLIVFGLMTDYAPLVTESAEIQLHELPEDTLFIQVDATKNGRSIVIYCIEEDGVQVIREATASRSTFIESNGEAKLIASKCSYPWYLNILFYRKPVQSWEFYLPAR